jgi:hypothetical protein
VNARLLPAPAPIETPVARRPSYDNLFLGYEQDWIEANAALLRQWWEAGEHDERDYAYFCTSQHEAEQTRREDFKNSLRTWE